MLRQDRKLFHTNDLALLWQISNKNTLYTTIKRYVKKGVLIPIHKGFYSTQDLKNIDPVVLGIGYLHQYAYLSTETILFKKGIINQEVFCVTLISNISRKFSIGSHSYKVRQLRDEFLYQTTGVFVKNGYNQASPERAAADLLYFDSNYHFDGEKLIDWDKVRFIQKKVGFK